MAKKGYWTAKRRAAFKKMRAGLARSRRVVTKRRTRRVLRRRRNPVAVLANPRRSQSTALVPYGFYQPARKKAPKMARRKRRRTRRVARRRPARRRARRIRRSVTVPRRRARRYRRNRRGRVIYMNPGRRRSRRRIRRRRNPSMGRGITGIFVPFAAGFIASMAAAGIDKMLATSPKMASLAKVGAAFLIGFAGRRYPRASVAAIGALAGSIGYPLGVRLAGGMVAATPQQAVQGLGSMARTYPQMGALLSGGMGALLSDAPSNLPAVASDYMTALRNRVDDD